MEYTDAGLVLSKGGKQEIAVIESQVACDGVKLLIKAGDAHFGVPCQKFEHALVDDVPVSLGYAEHGAAFQWSSSDQKYRMVLETDGQPLLHLLRSVCAASINGREIRIKQRVSPTAFNTETKPKTTSTTTSVSLDASTGVITFDDTDFSNISPQAATTVLIGSIDMGDRVQTAVQAEMLTPEETITTRFVFDSDRASQLVRDYIVADYTLSGTGGPISVLLIDDEPPLTDLAKTKIEEYHENMTVETATSVEQANQLLNTKSFDCVVSDYHMPGESIGDLISLMKHTDKSMPFLVFSRMAEEAVAPEDRPGGIDVWIEKNMGSKQYRSLGVEIKRLVAQKRHSGYDDLRVHPEATDSNNPHKV